MGMYFVVEAKVEAEMKHKHELMWGKVQDITSIKTHTRDLLSKILDSETVEPNNNIEDARLPSLKDVFQESEKYLETNYAEIHSILEEINAALFLHD